MEVSTQTSSPPEPETSSTKYGETQFRDALRPFQEALQAELQRLNAISARVDEQAKMLAERHEMEMEVMDSMKATMEICNTFIGTMDEAMNKLMEVTAALVLLATPEDQKQQNQ